MTPVLQFCFLSLHICFFCLYWNQKVLVDPSFPWGLVCPDLFQLTFSQWMFLSTNEAHCYKCIYPTANSSKYFFTSLEFAAGSVFLQWDRSQSVKQTVILWWKKFNLKEKLELFPSWDIVKSQAKELCTYLFWIIFSTDVWDYRGKKRLIGILRIKQTYNVYLFLTGSSTWNIWCWVSVFWVCKTEYKHELSIKLVQKADWQKGLISQPLYGLFQECTLD